MSRAGSAILPMPRADKEEVRLGVVLSVQFYGDGTDPGPASKMSYTVRVNGEVGPAVGIVPSIQRWDDTWDVDAIAPGTPVAVHIVGGRWHVLMREERHAEECP